MPLKLEGRWEARGSLFLLFFVDCELNPLGAAVIKHLSHCRLQLPLPRPKAETRSNSLPHSRSFGVLERTLMVRSLNSRGHESLDSRRPLKQYREIQSRIWRDTKQGAIRSSIFGAVKFPRVGRGDCFWSGVSWILALNTWGLGKSSHCL